MPTPSTLIGEKSYRTASRIFHIIVAAFLALPAGVAYAEEPPDQTLDENQPVVVGQTELRAGHVDIGPRYRDGAWTIQVHDDTVVPPVWRPLNDVVLRIGDNAVQPVPDDPAYAFLGQQPGQPVYVVPQTQNLDIVWVGWNTQDPNTMKAISRGVTMSLTGVQGPGRLSVYLQSGTLGAPDVLWDSAAKPYPQPLWVETNTHTHANWIFSAPGVYLVNIDISADLLDGKTVHASGAIRFAIGDKTPAADAFAAVFDQPPPPNPAGDTPTAAAEGTPPSSGDTTIVILIGVLGAAITAGLIYVLIRGARAKRRALGDHDPAGSAIDGGELR